MRSIRAKLALLVVASVVSATLLVCLATTWRDAQQQFALKRLELQGIAAAIATSVSQPLEAGDRDNVARMLSAVGRIPGLTFASVADANGQAVQQFGFGVVVGRGLGGVKANADIGPFTVVYLATYPVSAPIISGGRRIGELTLLADLSPLHSALLQSAVSALLAGAVAIVAGLLLASRLQRQIVEPVAELTFSLRDLGRTRDFTKTVGKTSNDEIGFLVDAFNSMLSEVRDRDEALSRHRDRLEIEVKERTAELAEAKLAAESANAAKSDFLATMSHEIRTPLNGMLVMAELMASGNLAPRFQRHADVLVSSGQSLLAIINDILDLSKIEAGKVDLESIPVDPRRIADDVLALYGEKARSKGLDFSAYAEPEVAGRIAADPVRLMQVLSNLVGNALKFTRAGSVSLHLSAKVGAEPGMQTVRFDVRDTGIGIAHDKLAGIFDPFSQADQSTTRRFGGTGIGLTISRRLVEAMGGNIAVSSKEGEGSVFSFEFPADVLQVEPQRTQVPVGEVATVVLAMPPSVTRDTLEASVRSFGFSPLVDAADSCVIGDWRDCRAVFGLPPALRLLAASARQGGRPAKWPMLVELRDLGEAQSTDGLEAGLADLSLELPVGCHAALACMEAIALGRADTTPDSGRDEAPIATSEGLKGIRVLAAEDNAVNREVLIEALTRLGMAVTCVEDGASALRLATSEPFEVILMDCSMPVMDGFEASRAIRGWEADTARAPIPIVALTAHVLGGKADAWRDAGMSDYLTKPFSLTTLRRCLERNLQDFASTQLPENTSLSGKPSYEPVQASKRGKVRQDAIDDLPILDLSVLDTIAEMQSPGDALVSRIVQLYATHGAHTLAQLQTATDKGKAQQIADAAHALRSASRNVGGLRIAELCAALEEQSRQGEITRAADYCAAIEIAFAETVDGLVASRRVLGDQGHCRNDASVRQVRHTQ